ncbi:MAG: serine/threonine-protein kinase [Deltaproteobacteria bacterium]
MSQAARGLDESVGPYHLIRAIGAGGSARIDLARIDRAYNFQRHVVIKRPLEHLRGDRMVAASLRREARIGGRLRHPNLVAVLDAGTHDGYDYLALEYIHGTSLRDLMQTEVAGQVRAVPLSVALGIVIDIARGLHDAHELVDERGEPLGLVHRDISPGNVLLGLDGTVKVADFGIAKETRVSTLSGSMHGTVTYMAPEQCRGHAFDRRADIWALGVILYELATHQRLFLADNDVASLHRVLSGQITRPRKLVASLPTSLEDIIMTTVAQDPAGRFATARELADALETFAAIQGLVVGARWLARTVEDAVGARSAPWVAATTVGTPPEHEPSLVSVIELDVEPEPELLPTFGPADGVAEEDQLPSASVATLAPRPSRGRWVPYAIAGALVGIGLGAVIALRGDDAPAGHAAAPPARSEPALQTPQAPPPAAPPPAEVEAEDLAAAPAPAGSGSPSRPASRAHRHHLTNPPPAGSNAMASQPAPDPTPPTPSLAPPSNGSAGSATPANVEWKPTMLLPTDKGSGTTKSP